MDGGAALIDAQTHPEAGTRVAPLAERLARGDAAAFDELVALYQGRITRVVFRLIGWGRQQDVEDIVQEVFLSALTAARSFRGKASLSTWLTAIAVNKCRSHRRRLSALWKRVIQAGGKESHRSSGGVAVGHGLLADETSARVREAVQALSARHREVVVLRYFEDLSLDEIAGATRQSKDAVEVRLHRARARLAEALRNLMEEERRP